MGCGGKPGMMIGPVALGAPCGGPENEAPADDSKPPLACPPRSVLSTLTATRRAAALETETAATIPRSTKSRAVGCLPPLGSSVTSKARRPDTRITCEPVLLVLSPPPATTCPGTCASASQSRMSVAGSCTVSTPFCDAGGLAVKLTTVLIRSPLVAISMSSRKPSPPPAARRRSVVVPSDDTQVAHTLVYAGRTEKPSAAVPRVISVRSPGTSSSLDTVTSGTSSATTASSSGGMTVMSSCPSTPRSTDTAQRATFRPAQSIADWPSGPVTEGHSVIVALARKENASALSSSTAWSSGAVMLREHV
mmetsp:Transcript_33643/g.85053  ORF Transcript_33643/g.85053 Transcript_33643/m.85053 type:complete len:307 (-) Transcript_33643:461-1381(-)